MRRLPKSVDYAAVGVSPVLIFLMISSLANFFVLLFHDGGYTSRLFYLIVMFTMGAVALARLVIEESRNYAAGYTIALGAAMLFVATGFVGNLLFSLGLIVLILYLADRIVHDCTLIDETVDASGEGLVDRGIEEWMGGKSDSKASESQSNAAKREKRKRSSQPGRTVFLLALAALPLFGVGQFMLQGDSATWSRAKLLLAIYLFSSLSLLVTTSFLNLRRYLRQRDVDMPGDVTVAWLTGGIALVGALLLIAFLAPLPGAMLAGWSPPKFGNEEQWSSRFGWGDEAAKNMSSEQDAGARQDSRPEGKDVNEKSKGSGNGESKDPSSSGSGSKSSGEKSSGAKQKQSGSGGEDGEKGSGGKNASKKGSGDQSGGKDAGKSKGSSGEQSSEKSGSKQDGKEKGKQTGENQSGDKGSSEKSGKQSGEKQSEQGDSGKPNESDSGANSESDQSSPDGNDSPDSRQDQAGKPSDGKNQDGNPSSQSEPKSSSNVLGNLFSGIASLLKLLLMLALVAVVLYYAYLMRDQILAWWRSLFERDAKPVTASGNMERVQARPPPRPFSSFQNPIGRESDPQRIIVVTFQAFEAWSRERGWDRSPEETPSEFIARLRRVTKERFDAKAIFGPLFRPAQNLATTYDRIAYGKGRASKADVENASQLWQQMQASTTAPPAANPRQ
ncbi:MAG: DUF4129 domain-containing protein [Planctomycetota bacterium]